MILNNPEQTTEENDHHIRELKQKINILLQLENHSTDKVNKLQESNKNLKEKLQQKSLSLKETVQEKIFLDEMSKNEISKIQVVRKKYYLTIAVAGIVLAGVIVPYSLYVVTLVGEEYRVQDVELVTSGYVIQNLKGDTIDTWLSWRLVEGDIMHVNIVDGHKFPEKAEIIKNAILSTETIEIDNSLLHKGPKGTTSVFYLGWAGALEKSSETPTSFFIPTKFDVTESASGTGDITIRLSTDRSGDAYSGWTKSIADETQNQILKSEIIIYDIDNLTDNQLTTIMRHEFGHALGLAHSSDPEDLMAPTITTEFPYISECDVDAIVGLYDGAKKSEVICEK